MSTATERMFSYPAPRVQDNELFSQFKYTELEGFDYNGHDGTISRRDPSKVIFANGKYYVWYTHRHTPTSPKGATSLISFAPRTPPCASTSASRAVIRATSSSATSMVISPAPATQQRPQPRATTAA